VLIRGVIENELRDDPQPAAVRLVEEELEVGESADVRVHVGVFGDVVAVVASRRGIERQEPDGGDAEVLEVIELAGEAAQIADPVVVAVEVRTRSDLVDDRVLVPGGFVQEAHGAPRFGAAFHERPSPARP
jgi:hypothetical protein